MMRKLFGCLSGQEREQQQPLQAPKGFLRTRKPESEEGAVLRELYMEYVNVSELRGGTIRSNFSSHALYAY